MMMDHTMWNDLARPCFAVVQSISDDILETYLDTFPIFEALNSFSWHGYNPAYPLAASDNARLRTLLDAFPSPATLTHLSIGTNDFTFLKHIVALLEHPTLALLTNLDFPLLPATAPIDIEQPSARSKVDAMAKACKERGIQLSMEGIEARAF
ncbi:hypothetical protein RQP46_003209 [Phenoliferia psychrophenolica]